MEAVLGRPLLGATILETAPLNSASGQQVVEASYIFDLFKALANSARHNQNVDGGRTNSGSYRKMYRITRMLLKLGVDASFITFFIYVAVLSS